MFRIVLHAILLASLTSLSGCGGGGAAGGDRPKTTLASGVVTYKNAPVEGAIVTLNRVDREYGATGVTNQNGEFQLSAFAGEPGVVPGEYYVTIMKPAADPNANKSVDQDDPSYNPENEPVGGNDGEAPPPPKLASQLPEKYASPVTSGFKETIGETPRTDLKYDLVD
jgi:hypothetical protein